MTKRREHRVESNEKAGLSSSPVGYLARQTRYESELISTSLVLLEPLHECEASFSRRQEL